MGLPPATVKKFLPITKQHAQAIAVRAAMSHGGQLECHSRKPDNCRLYGINTDQPCWYVCPPMANNQLTLRSSRVIIISRQTGEILYDGSAGDEG